MSFEAKRIDARIPEDRPIQVLARAELFSDAIEIVVWLTFWYVVAMEPAILNLGQLTKAITIPMRLNV